MGIFKIIKSPTDSLAKQLEKGEMLFFILIIIFAGIGSGFIDATTEKWGDGLNEWQMVFKLSILGPLAFSIQSIIGVGVLNFFIYKFEKKDFYGLTRAWIFSHYIFIIFIPVGIVQCYFFYNEFFCHGQNLGRMMFGYDFKEKVMLYSIYGISLISFVWSFIVFFLCTKKITGINFLRLFIYILPFEVLGFIIRFSS